MAILFAFDFIVENMGELRKDNVHAVEFKLLDFPAVSLILGARARHTSKPVQHIGSRSVAKVNKGKSVVFEMDPEELLQELKKTPLKVRLLRFLTERRPIELPIKPLKPGATLTDEGMLDLSEMAASMEVLMTSEKLHMDIDGDSKPPCRYCSRNTVVITNDAMAKATKLCVKVRLVCITDNELTQRAHHDTPNEVVPEGVENGQNRERATDEEVNHPSLQSVEKAPEIQERKTQTSNSDGNVNFSGRAGMNESCRDNPTDTDDASDPTTPATCVSMVDSDTPHLSKEVYIPNSICPPPLVYHSEQHKASVCTWHRELPLHNAPLCPDEVWCDHIVQDEGYNDWSVLAEYDPTSHPITTQLKGLKRKPNRKTILDPKHVLFPDASALVGNLPLLSALMKELSCLNSPVKLSDKTAHEKPEKVRVSTSSQTERILSDLKKDKAETGLVKEHKVRIYVDQHPRKTRGGGFIRECCMAVRSRKKLVPSNKSVLYPPDIKHKQRCQKRLKGGKLAATPLRKPPSHGKQVTIKRKQARKESDNSSMALPETESVGLVDTHPSSTSIKKLELFVPIAPQSPAALSSPSVSNDSSAVSPTMVRREMIRMNAETQTEGIADGGEEMASAREQSVQTETGSLVQNSETCDVVVTGSSDSGTAPTLPSSNLSPIPVLESTSLQGNSPHSLLFPPSQLEEDSPSPNSSPLSLPVKGSRWEERRQSDAPQSLPKFKLSRHKFSSTGDVRAPLPESPLLRSTMKDSLTFLHETGLHAECPENALQMIGRSLNAAGSQTFDSFMSTDMLATVGERGILPKHCREGIVFLATSQSSLASETGEGGLLEGTEESGMVAGNKTSKELSEEVKEKVTETAETTEEADYSDDFEDSDSWEDSTDSD